MSERYVDGGGNIPVLSTTGYIERDFKQAYIKMKEHALDARDAIDLMIDVLKTVKQTYRCPDSPVINLAIERGYEALTRLPPRS